MIAETLTYISEVRLYLKRLKKGLKSLMIAVEPGHVGRRAEAPGQKALQMDLCV
jgi:hypothetical protein